MASEQIISVRVTQEFFDQYSAYVTAHFGDARGARTVALFDALNAQMNGGAAWLNQAHSDQKMLIKELERELEKLRTRPERIPTPKKKPRVYVLSEHTKARLAVYKPFAPIGGHYLTATSSDIALVTGQSTNNVAKRIQELVSEGYLEATGEYRKSRDSGKILAVWVRSSKQYTSNKKD